MAIRDETWVDFQHGKELVPPHNAKHAPTEDQLRGYTQRGIAAKRNGKRVFLEWFQEGSRSFTTVEAYIRFHEALWAENMEGKE